MHSALILETNFSPPPSKTWTQILRSRRNSDGPKVFHPVTYSNEISLFEFHSLLVTSKDRTFSMNALDVVHLRISASKREILVYA
jgi:hypothetical protein